MKITDVRALHLRAPLERPRAASHRRGPSYAIEAALVRIATDAGVVGWGEALSIPEIMLPIVEKVFKPMLIGKDPSDIEGLWETMYFGVGYHGMKGILIEAISALDIALWDLKGRALGRPIYELLGMPVQRKRLRAYATGLYFSPLEELKEEARGYVRDGFEAMKVKIGRGMEEDWRIVRALREEIGPDVGLMADANCAFSVEEAIALGRRFEDLGLRWFEEPIIVEDLDGYARVCDALSLDVAAGEGEYTRWGFKAVFEKGAVDVVQPDAMRAGGLSECLKIAELSVRHGIPYAPHVWCSVVGLAASTHLAAVLPNFEIFEYESTPNPLRDDLAVAWAGVEKSYVTVPEGPGWGIEISPAALERFTVAQSE